MKKGKTAVEKLNSDKVSAVEIDIADDESINKAFDELNGKIDEIRFERLQMFYIFAASDYFLQNQEFFVRKLNRRIIYAAKIIEIIISKQF